MNGATPSHPEPAPAWRDACEVGRLLSVGGATLGGVWLRARAGPVRDRWLAVLQQSLPPGTPVVRIPLQAGDERVLGGLDLAATLATGRPVAERGLLAAASGGIALLPMAERMTSGGAARFAYALDTGETLAERDGWTLRDPARIAVVALDEGIDPDERPPASLTDRLAFHLDLNGLSHRDAPLPDDETVRRRTGPIGVPDDAIEALCEAASAYGIDSARAPILALATARAAASLAGRPEIAAEDLALAARLVLAPRATRWPAERGEALPDDGEAPSPAEQPGQGEAESETAGPTTELDDVVREAVAAALPADLLAGLPTGPSRRSSGSASGSGAERRDPRRGRPAGTLRGDPSRGARLNVVETLRAAAPWQRLRPPPSGGRIAIRRDDLRITRFKRKVETTTIFVVDASGSSAFHRLAEAKGAVELLLAECYVRRDRVALMAFRGTGAELLLPPTRSLTRTKRSLAALPGGGGTPLAVAIDAALALATTITRGGGSAVLVFMTDGRANIGRDGNPGREAATRDALASARTLREAGATALLIDISHRPSEAAAAVAREMSASYLPLPAADARTLSGLVQRETAAAARGAR